MGGLGYHDLDYKQMVRVSTSQNANMIIVEGNLNGEGLT